MSVAAFIGVGSYLATYRTLVIISTPAAIAPIPVGSAVSVAAPVPVPAAT